MRLTTLCYVEHEGRWLMLHRTRKQEDENAGKWIGLGGHMQEDESPEECIRREVQEESGLQLSDLQLRGILTFILPDWGNELTFLYTARSETDAFSPCDEGELRWIPVGDVLSLSLWEGDRLFLPLLLEKRNVFSMKLVYAPGGKLIGHEVRFG